MKYQLEETNDMFESPYKALNLMFGESNPDFNERIYLLGISGDRRVVLTPFVKDLYNKIRSTQFDDEFDYYISANTFQDKTPKHNNDSVFGLRNVVIDINFVQDAKDKHYDYERYSSILEMLLIRYWNECNYPAWNFVVNTGKGIQLWWCINETSKDLRFIYEGIRKEIIEEINHVLKMFEGACGTNVAVENISESRISGLFRLPGSYNVKAARFSQVRSSYYCSQARYDINKLKDGFSLHKAALYNNATKLVTNQPNQKQLYRNGLAFHRMTVIETLVLLRGRDIVVDDVCIYLFHYYNEAVQYYEDRQLAVNETFRVNRLFSSHIENDILLAIFSGVDTSRNKKDNNHHYNYTNERIILNLSINSDEQDRFCFYAAIDGHSDKNFVRNERRRLKKEKRDELITSEYLNNCSYAEIARQAGCCIDTVKAVIKKMSEVLPEPLNDLSEINKPDEIVEINKDIKEIIIKAYESLFNKSYVFHQEPFDDHNNVNNTGPPNIAAP